MTKKKDESILSASELRENVAAALALGREFGDWDEDQLAQSAEYANSIAPELRSLAGYADGGHGTFTDSEDLNEDELNANEDDMFAAFWEGYGMRSAELSAARRAKKISAAAGRRKGILPGGKGDALTSGYMGQDASTPMCSSCGKRPSIGAFTFEDEGIMLEDRELCESCAEDYGQLEDEDE